MSDSVVGYDIEQIIVKYRPIVSFRVRRLIGSHLPEWEDIVNEIMTNVIEQLTKNKFRGDSSIGTFIYTITNRRITDYIREKGKIYKHIPEKESIPQPHLYVENKEKAKYLVTAIEQLKPKYKEILYLYYYKELNRKEIAKILGISPSRVSERVNYAVKLLRKVIKK